MTFFSEIKVSWFMREGECHLLSVNGYGRELNDNHFQKKKERKVFSHNKIETLGIRKLKSSCSPSFSSRPLEFNSNQPNTTLSPVLSGVRS